MTTEECVAMVVVYLVGAWSIGAAAAVTWWWLREGRCQGCGRCGREQDEQAGKEGCDG